jgi:hypothetical protein
MTNATTALPSNITKIFFDKAGNSFAAPKGFPMIEEMPFLTPQPMMVEVQPFGSLYKMKFSNGDILVKDVKLKMWFQNADFLYRLLGGDSFSTHVHTLTYTTTNRLLDIGIAALNSDTDDYQVNNVMIKEAKLVAKYGKYVELDLDLTVPAFTVGTLAAVTPNPAYPLAIATYSAASSKDCTCSIGGSPVDLASMELTLKNVNQPDKALGAANVTSYNKLGLEWELDVEGFYQANLNVPTNYATGVALLATFGADSGDLTTFKFSVASGAALLAEPEITFKAGDLAMVKAKFGPRNIAGTATATPVMTSRDGLNGAYQA